MARAVAVRPNRRAIPKRPVEVLDRHRRRARIGREGHGFVDRRLRLTGAQGHVERHGRRHPNHGRRRDTLSGCIDDRRHDLVGSGYPVNVRDRCCPSHTAQCRQRRTIPKVHRNGRNRRPACLDTGHDAERRGASGHQRGRRLRDRNRGRRIDRHSHCARNGAAHGRSHGCTNARRQGRRRDAVNIGRRPSGPQAARHCRERHGHAIESITARIRNCRGDLDRTSRR